MKDSQSVQPSRTQWIRDEIRAASAYKPTVTGARIKLDAMESPYNLDSDLQEKWMRKLRNCNLNRYPDKYQQLHDKLASHFGLSSDYGLIMGNGSDELLQIVAMSVADRCLLSVIPDFSMYPVIARNCGLQYIGVPLTDDFSLDVPAVLAKIKQYCPSAIWLSCPNNPTGKVWDREQVEKIIRNAPGVVLVDEAYAPYGNRDWLDDLTRFDNLLIARTFSKIGLAGLRFGILLGRRELIAELDKLRLPYNVSVLTQSSAEFILDCMAYFEEKVEVIKSERERLYNALTQIAGGVPIRSHANFILIKIMDNAIATHDQLYERGILVKHFPDDPVLRQYLRITVGSPEENDMLVSALAAVMQ